MLSLFCLSGHRARPGNHGLTRRCTRRGAVRWLGTEVAFLLATCTASRPLQFAPSGATISRGSGRAALALARLGAARVSGRVRWTARTMVAWLVLALALPAAQAEQSSRCSHEEGITAETVVDYLDSWANVYVFFKQFGHCYDAAIAEGADAKIQELWTDHWPQLQKMIALTKKDPAFRAFIWARIADEDFTQEDFAKLVRRAKMNCPMGAAAFCAEVLRVSKARSAL